MVFTRQTIKRALAGLFLLMIMMINSEASNLISRKAEITNYCLQAASKKSLKSYHIGIYIASVNHVDTPLFTYNADSAYVPASCIKLATSAAALDALGPDYIFQTRVYAVGSIDRNGTLKGNLVIYGTGDPSMSDRYPPHRVTAPLEMLADQVYKHGIRKIEGNIIGDGTYFDKQEIGTGWSYSYLYDWYAARVTALALNDNCINIKVLGGKKIGDLAQVQLDPPTRYIKINNNVKTVSSKTRSAVSFDREYGSEIINLKGRMPAGKNSGVLWASVNDPLKYTADVFRETLLSKGIKVDGTSIGLRQPNRTAVTSQATLVAVRYSPPLRELIKPVNKNSQNLYAEMLLKSLGKVKYGQGSYPAGLKAVKDFMRKANPDIRGYDQFDGCGLSPYNQITPKQLCGVLSYMHRHKDFDIYFESLSIPGVDGSLKSSRLYNLSHQLRGKTGGIKGVRALTGYLTTKSGDQLVFSFLSNHVSSRYAVQTMENTILEKLADM